MPSQGVEALRELDEISCPQLVEKGLDVAAGERPFDVEALENGLDELLAGCPVGKEWPDGGAGLHTKSAGAA